MTFYSDLAAVASALLTDKGQTISFSRDNVTAFDPASGSETKGAPVTFSGKGAIFGYNASEVDGTVVQQDDKRLILEAVDTPPLIGDEATVGSVAHRVISVETVAPAGEAVIYKAQLRA